MSIARSLKSSLQLDNLKILLLSDEALQIVPVRWNHILHPEAAAHNLVVKIQSCAVCELSPLSIQSDQAQGGSLAHGLGFNSTLEPSETLNWLDLHSDACEIVEIPVVAYGDHSLAAPA